MHNLLRKIDLTSLRLFVAVCQEKNIARAAEREFIAPSAVSRRIADIEAAIGLPVIQRQARGIAVTPVGETVFRHAQAAIGNIEAMSAELSQYFSGVKGSVRVVVSQSSIVQFLPEDIAAFQRLFPEVNIDLEEQNSIQILRTIDERAADLGICNTVPGFEEFQYLPYRTDHLVLVVPKGHHLAGANQISLADILQDDFVGCRDETALATLLAREAAKLDGKLKVKIRVLGLDALCRMVHVGLGVAIVPQQVAELYLNVLDIDLVPLTDPWATRQVVVIYKSKEQLTATAASLVNFLTNKS